MDGVPVVLISSFWILFCNMNNGRCLGVLFNTVLNYEQWFELENQSSRPLLVENVNSNGFSSPR